ncbi:hypothetical protein T10_4346 [Trichinella papuae]|uniref:Uncharacterized protein n=1 Tax=Trichinella papuae TaxID=268474 RepID=A0A0V1N9A6_9BILA|nr:hypothetical protein T10_4346 [Trichinella papuae]
MQLVGINNVSFRIVKYLISGFYKNDPYLFLSFLCSAYLAAHLANEYLVHASCFVPVIENIGYENKSRIIFFWRKN